MWGSGRRPTSDRLGAMLRTSCDEGRQADMSRRRILAGLLLSLVAPLVAEAQQAAKITRIGWLAGNLAAFPHMREAFPQGLRDLGYVEGRNLVIEIRSAEGKLERLPALAAELVALKDILKEADVAGRALGVRLQFVEARGLADFDRAFSDMTRARAGALNVLGGTMLLNERRRLVDLAAKNRLPAAVAGRFDGTARYTASHSVVCYPEPCVMACSLPVTNTAAPQGLRGGNPWTCATAKR
jgi:hypothetical protein